MVATLHEPTPDGKTGPFLRSRHNRNDAGYTYDSRCGACRLKQSTEQRIFEEAFDRYVEEREPEGLDEDSYNHYRDEQ